MYKSDAKVHTYHDICKFSQPFFNMQFQKIKDKIKRVKKKTPAILFVFFCRSPLLPQSQQASAKLMEMFEELTFWR